MLQMFFLKKRSIKTECQFVVFLHNVTIVFFKKRSIRTECQFVIFFHHPPLITTARSPVFSYLSATLQGLHTIRAMHMEQKLTAEFDAHQDLHTEAWFLFVTSSRWFGVRLDWLSVIFIASVVYCSVLTADSKCKQDCSDNFSLETDCGIYSLERLRNFQRS